MTAPAAKPGPLHPDIVAARDYPFTILGRRFEELRPADVPALSFAAGDPREETPRFIIEAMVESVPAMSSYPRVAGQPELRSACSRWLKRRFDVELDPELNLAPLNGSKEGIWFLPLAVMGSEEGKDTIVIPTPGYPPYERSARFARANLHMAPLRSDAGWCFEPDDVPEDVWKRTALLWLNSPNNPTGAVLPLDTLQRVVDLARRHGFWVASDEAYCDVYFGEKPPSALQCGSDNVIAFHTLSKRSAMTGFRTGFMAGDSRLIEALRRYRPNIGASTPDFIQKAAIVAWDDDAHPQAQRKRYAAKRDICLEAFRRYGWSVEASEASFYLWFKAPGGDDVAFVEQMMKRGVVALPGSFLGEAGQGYVRWALVPTVDECREGVERLEGLANG
jgi:acetylornithine aminotransferase